MFVNILLNTSVSNLDRLFSYKVPKDMEEKISVGKRVWVPLGKGNRKEIGVILSITDKIDFDVNLAKDILEVIDDEPLISEFSIKLAKWISKRYICRLSDALRLMFPPDVIKKDKRIRTSKKDKFIYLNEDNQMLEYYENIKGLTPKRKEVLEFLINVKVILLPDLLDFFNTSRPFLKWFEDNNLIEIKEEIKEENLFEKYSVKMEEKNSKVILNEEQQSAYDNLSNILIENEYREVLLHGVTGSGKTEVYMQVIEKTLELGKNAIVLVPEISLTPQMANRFISRFGNMISILHSKLSYGQRIDEYAKIKKGDIRIVIGARSAIFSPITNIGVIVIDEEHDLSYKSESTPKYDAKEVARKMCQYNKCLLLLGSATPSIQTYYKTQTGEIELLTLKNRTNNSILPNIEIVDMKEERYIDSGSKIISKKLYNEIEKNLQNKEQTIIFLNKRGYCSSIVCKECGYVYKCPNCDVSLTYHKDKHSLLCHYCGYNERVDKKCKMCTNTDLSTNTVGTQKIENELKNLFPNASIIRMDHDTTQTKDSHINIVNKFKNENIDILIGTQMIAKGHDFPNVTLVGILNADMSLYLQDYKSNELTFGLLTQVAGRAGRKDKEGRVILQTYQPENSIFSYIKENDYTKLYNEEIRFRQILIFPPFCDIIQFVFVGEKENNVISASSNMFNYLKDKLLEFANAGELLVFPPVQALLSKIDNKYIYKLNIKCRYSEKLAIIFKQAIKDNIDKYDDVRIDIEINSNRNI